MGIDTQAMEQTIVSGRLSPGHDREKGFTIDPYFMVISHRDRLDEFNLFREIG
jgi:hypothetical protein